MSDFSDWPLEFSGTTWISLPNRLTLGRALRDPIGARARVVEEMQQEECRMESGERVRWDLKDLCHADVYANVSVVLWASCKRRHLKELYGDVIDTTDKELQESVNPQHRMRSK